MLAYWQKAKLVFWNRPDNFLEEKHKIFVYDQWSLDWSILRRFKSLRRRGFAKTGLREDAEVLRRSKKMHFQNF